MAKKIYDNEADIIKLVVKMLQAHYKRKVSTKNLDIVSVKLIDVIVYSDFFYIFNFFCDDSKKRINVIVSFYGHDDKFHYYKFILIDQEFFPLYSFHYDTITLCPVLPEYNYKIFEKTKNNLTDKIKIYSSPNWLLENSITLKHVEVLNYEVGDYINFFKDKIQTRNYVREYSLDELVSIFESINSLSVEFVSHIPSNFIMKRKNNGSVFKTALKKCFPRNVYEEYKYYFYDSLHDFFSEAKG